MTDQVITATPDTRFKDLVALLAENAISAVPVVDDGRVVGVVSEADLLPKEEYRGGADDPPGLFAGKAARKRWAQAHALTAADLMTTPVRTIRPDARAAAAAHAMAEAGVRRLFVVSPDGALVGVLSRRDLLKVFVRRDDELVAAIRDEVLGRSLWLTPGTVDVDVKDGVVTIRGEVERRSEVGIAGYLASVTPGVVAVHNHISATWDDTVPPRREDVRG
ncbi:CBS domain-containing protein [Actinokineospora fastidiosa]|nr:CBS domain-containing protein [Actinokineospora fastidiosa]